MMYEELYEGLMEELDLTKEIDDMQLVEVIHAMLEEKSKEYYLPLKEKSKLGKELFNAFRRLDLVQELLEDEEITEIMINGTDYIFVEKNGKLFQTDKRFTSRRKLEDVIQNMVSGANRSVNEASPIVDARLEDGSRINIVLYPIALNGPVVTIRKFPKEIMKMQNLLAKGTLNQEMVLLLEKLMISRYNLFISGGTGSG